MICIIHGERAAMVEYRVDGHAVAHYRLPEERGRSGDARIRTVRRGGVAIARWSDGSFEHALVSGLSEERHLEIAREVAGGL